MLRNELSGIQVTVPTDILRLVKFVRKVIKKNNSPVEEFEALQNTVTDEKASRTSVKKELGSLRS